jgi:methylglyoxal synthase
MTVSLAEEFNDFNVKLAILRICETQNEIMTINLPTAKLVKQDEERENSDDEKEIEDENGIDFEEDVI